MNSDDEKLVIYNRFELNGGVRTNSMKLLHQGPFIQMYVNNGKDRRDNFDKYAQFRLSKENLKTLRDWLNAQEIA